MVNSCSYASFTGQWSPFEQGSPDAATSYGQADSFSSPAAYRVFALVLRPAVSVKRMASSRDIATGCTADRGTSTM